MICNTCHYKYTPAPSKRAGVCPNCKHLARTGETIEAKRKRKHKEMLERMRAKSAKRALDKPVVKKPKIAPLSLKGVEKEKALSALKNYLKQESREGAFSQCQGCLKYFDHLDASHKVAESRNRGLALDRGNITLLCRDCHNKWENGTVPDMLTLHCFLPDVEYIFHNDNERFQKIMFRLLDAYETSPFPKLQRIIEKMERFESCDPEE